MRIIVTKCRSLLRSFAPRISVRGIVHLYSVIDQTSDQGLVETNTLNMALRSAVNTVAKRVALATAAQVCITSERYEVWKRDD